jgi:hypothetical protein
LRLKHCSAPAFLELHDGLVGSIFNKARRRRDEAFQSSGKAINEKVRLYARIEQALLAAKEEGADPVAAIERIVSWVDFAQTVSEAEQLAQPEDFDFLGLISNRFRRCADTHRPMLDIFDFRAAPNARPLLEVIDILRVMNRDKSRSIPQNARRLSGSASAGDPTSLWTMGKIPARQYLAAVLPGLGNSSNQKLPELTPTAWAASNL